MAPYRSSLEEMILREYQFTRSISFCVRKSECPQSPQKTLRRQRSEPSLDPNAVQVEVSNLCSQPYSNEGDRAPGSLVSIIHPSMRSRVPTKSVSFSESCVTDFHEFVATEGEYEDFPYVPSYEYLEHDDYYEIMAEMVAELKQGGPNECPDEDEGGDNCEYNPDETQAATSEFDDEKIDPRARSVGACDVPQKQLLVKTSFDSSSESDTLPSSHDDWSDQPVRKEPIRTAPVTKLESPSGPIPKIVIYQSPVIKKERKSSLKALKRSLRLVSL